MDNDDARESGYDAGGQAVWRNILAQALRHLPEARPMASTERHDALVELKTLHVDMWGEDPEWDDMRLADCVDDVAKAWSERRTLIETLAEELQERQWDITSENGYRCGTCAASCAPGGPFMHTNDCELQAALVAAEELVGDDD